MLATRAEHRSLVARSVSPHNTRDSSRVHLLEVASSALSNTIGGGVLKTALLALAVGIIIGFMFAAISPAPIAQASSSMTCGTRFNPCYVKIVP